MTSFLSRANTVLCCALTLTMLTAPRPAAAQDDWGVDESPERREEIIARYLSIVRARPERGAIFDRLLQELGGGSRFDRMLADFQEQSAADHSSLADALILGHLLMHAGRYDEAVVAYSRAVDAQPPSSVALHAMGDAYRALEQREPAEAAYIGALEGAADDDDRSDLLQELADLAFERRDWQTAEEWGAQLVAIDPSDVYVRADLASVMIEHQRYEQALAQYEAVEELAGRDTRQRAMAIKDQADVQALMGDATSALASYERAASLVDEGYWLRREIEQRVIALYRENGELDLLVRQFVDDWRRPTLRQWMIIAGLYDELGQTEQAVEAYRSAVANDRRSVEARMALIRMLERRGEMDSVLDQLRALAREQPGDADVRFRLVDVYRRTGLRAEAVDELDSLAERFRSTPHILLDVAERYSRLDEMGKSREIFERLVRIQPDVPGNYVALGEFHFMDGRRSQAEDTWAELLRIIRPRAEALAAYGAVLADHALNEEAIEAYVEAHSLEPENDRVVRELGQLYESTGVLPASLRFWTMLYERTALPQTRTEARGAIIRLNDELGRLPDIVEDRRFALQADPDDAEAAYFLGAAFRFVDDDRAAEDVYATRLASHPDDLIALLALESILSRQNRIAEAIEVLVRIAEVSPGRARDTYQRLAELSLRNYDDVEAVRFAQLAVSLNPDDASGHARLGDIYRRMLQLDEAAMAYRQALLLNERGYEPAFALAEVYLALDRPREAAGLYRSIVENSTDEADVLQAGREAITLGEASGGLDGLLGVFEARMYDPERGVTYLRLLVEAFDATVVPLENAALYGDALGREDARAALSSLTRRASRPLLDALVSDDLRLRERALGLLSRHGTEGATLPLARLFDDPSLRWRAMVAVARIGSPAAAPAFARIATETSGSEQLLALWALGNSGGDGAVASLVEVWNHPRAESFARSLAIVGLARQSALEPAMVSQGLNDEHDRVRRAAAWAAGASEDGTETVLLRVAVEHSGVFTATAAAWALGQLPMDAESAETLVSAYFFAEARISAQALRSLSSPGRPLLAYPNELVLVGDTVVGVDVDGLLDELLRQQGAPSPPRPPAVQAMMRQWSAALARDGQSAQRALLLARDSLAPDEDDSSTVSTVWQPLMRELVASDLEALGGVAVSASPTIRALALEVWRRSGVETDRLLSHAADALDGPHALAGEALATYARFGGDDGVRLLSDALRSEEWERRLVAAAAAAEMPEPVIIEQLFLLAEDPFVSVQIEAIGAAAHLDPQRSLSWLETKWEELPVLVKLRVWSVSAAWPAELRSRLEARCLTDIDPRVRAATTW